MTQVLDIKFSNLEYKCERPNSNIRSKKLWPIIKFGRMVEEYSNYEKPAIRDYKEDLARVTSYFYFDHMGRYVQISRCLNQVLSYDIELNTKKSFKHSVDIEQHCFDQLVERKISIKSIITALKHGKEVVQFCKDKRSRKLYKNVSVFYKDLRVVASIFNDNYRIKTAYRLTDLNDKNLLEKLKKNQHAFTHKFSNPHNYAIVDMDKLYQSTMITNNESSASKNELYSSIKKYRNKTFKQSDYNPKREYGLIFFYEKDSFMALAKRIYGIGLSSKIVYKEKKVSPVNKKELLMVGISLTATSGHEWIKSSDRKEIITINALTRNE